MSSYDFHIYAKQRNLVKSKIRFAQCSYEEHLIYKFTPNPKAFYSYVKSKQKIKTSIPHLNISDNSTTSNNMEIAEVLNSFFRVLSLLRILMGFLHFQEEAVYL